MWLRRRGCERATLGERNEGRCDNGEEEETKVKVGFITWREGLEWGVVVVWWGPHLEGDGMIPGLWEADPYY